MPELPEVETVRRGLTRTIAGKTVRSVDVRTHKLFTDSPSLIAHVLTGVTVKRIDRRAKVLLVELSSGWGWPST